jgi:MFS transporter, DHA2 family, multidrug resistance protein
MRTVTPDAVSPVPSPVGQPPIGIAVQMIGVMTIAMIGSSISSQLVDLGIADIGGGFSISADNASWIACIATMAEVSAIPIAALLVRALSLRVVVIWTTALYVLFAFGSLNVTDESGLLLLRAMQSFCSGILSVLLFVTIMVVLPAGPKRLIGLTVFAFASTAPAAVAATVGGFVTDRFGWQGLYYFDLTWSLTLLGLAVLLLRPSPPTMRLTEIDWLSYPIVAIGLAELILFMKQGDRFFWLENPTITRAVILAAIIIPMAAVLLLFRKRPLIDLSLLTKSSFGWAVTLATCYRFGLVMTAFVVPQVLTRLQGFRLPEIGEANIWMFWAECIAFPLAWVWATRWDARSPISLGLALFAIGAFICTRLTPAWQANDFRLAMIVIGFGQGLFLVPTLFYATRDVAPQQGPTAATLFNLSRVVGQTFGIAVIGSLITWREKFHSAILVDAFNNANPAVTERFNQLVAGFLAIHGDRALARLQAWESLSGTASNEALVLAFADAFLIIALVLGVSAIVVLMLPRLRDKTKAPDSFVATPPHDDALAAERQT